MPTILFSQLIDAAIGSPDAGHVDFHALQLLLYHFAEKLDILNSQVDISNFGNIAKCLSKMGKNKPNLRNTMPERQLAGSDEPTDAPPENVEESAAAEEPVEETTVTQDEPPLEEVQTATNEDIPEMQQEQPVEDLAIQEVAEQEPFESGAPVATEDLTHMLSQEKTEAALDVIKQGAVVEMKYITPIPEDLSNGISVMKNQIELAMEQLNLLNNIATRGRRDVYLDSLKALNQKMRRIQKSNVFIESGYQGIDLSSDFASEEDFEECVEEDTFKRKSVVLEVSNEPKEQVMEANLEYHLCYPPDKMMDQLLELKSEFCIMTNKLNDIMIVLREMDSQRTKVILSELQEQMRDIRYLITILKDSQEIAEQKQKTTIETLTELEKTMELIRKNKVDRTEMELLLADKVDYVLLERKVSHEFLKEAVCRIEKQFCEVQRLINFNEKHALQVIENMRKNLGLDNIDLMLKNFRDKVDQDILKLQSILQNYLDSTNDECAAAGARVKVLKDLACLSCDANCVMRTMEKSKIGKLPNAFATPALGPLISYELGSIRKSGIMGYYRKDEFPHAPNAWKNRQTASLKICVPRHAGGTHTTYTAKDHNEKVIMNKLAK